MTEQQDFDIQESTKKVVDLVEKISAGKLTSEQINDAKKAIDDIQKLTVKALKKINEILPELTDAELRIVNAQKFGIADSVINQIFDDSNKILNETEQTQFMDLLTKVLTSAPKRTKNKIFKAEENLKDALYLHNDDARKKMLKKS